MLSNLKTWTPTVINTALNGADQRIQYREVFYFLKNLFVLAGWTREWTCNSLVADANDNLPNAAAVVIGLNGSQPISYFVYAAPTNFPGSGMQMRVAVWTNASNASANPTAAGIAISRGIYALAAGAASLTTRPIAQYQEKIVPNTVNMTPWPALVNATVQGVTSNVGDVIIYVKETGQARIRMFTMVTGKGLIDNQSQGAQIAHLVHTNTTAATSCLTYTLLSATSWAALDHSGGSTLATTGAWSPLEVATNWTNGLDGAGDMDWFPWWVANGAAGFTQAVNFGFIPDILSVPPLTPFGTTNPADLAAIVDVSIGVITVPVTAAQLPFT